MPDLAALTASVISIYAPHKGCDGAGLSPINPARYFNPRTPQGVRLFLPVVSVFQVIISIHAPHKGCD